MAKTNGKIASAKITPQAIVPVADAAQGLLAALHERLAAPPDYIEALRDQAGQGAEDIDESAVQVPRVVIAQKLSEVINEKVVEYLQLYNSMYGTPVWPLPGIHALERADVESLQEDFQKNPLFLDFNNTGQARLVLPFVVVDCFRDRTYFDERKLVCASERGGFCTRDGFVSPATGERDCAECPLGQWTGEGDDRKAPECNENINALCVLPTEPADRRVAAVVFASSSAKYGRKLEGFLKASAKLYPSWARWYGVWVVEEQFQAGPAGVFRIRDLGWAARDIVAEAGSVYATLQERGAVIDAVDETAGLEPEAPLGTTGDVADARIWDDEPAAAATAPAAETT